MNENKLPLILGSSSPFRKEEMEKAGFTFKVLVSGIPEEDIVTPVLRERPLVLARQKAEALLPQITEPSLLITADVIVICNETLLEKPKDREENKAWLRLYSTYPAEIISAIVVTNTQTGERFEGMDNCMCYFDAIPDEAIDAYTKEGTSLTAAGGFTHEIFMAHGKDPKPSSDRRRGIPLDLLKNLLQQAGMSF